MSLRAPRLTPVVWGLLAAVAVVAAVGAESAGGPAMPQRAGDLAAGLALLGGGALAWIRRPRAGAGPLMLASGLTWFAGDLSSALLYAHRGPLVHLLLTYPSGRTSSRVTLAVIAAAYVDGLVPDLARSGWATLALMSAVLLVAAARHRAAGGVERRARAAALSAAALLSATLGLAALGRLLDAGTGDAAVWALYSFWRPVTAIHEAASDGNDATQADPDWTSLIGAPPYPDHPSGLSAVGCSVTDTMQHFYGRDQATYNGTTLGGVTRTFTSFSQLCADIVDARVWSGIHFRFADEEAAKIGRRVAHWGNRHAFR